MTREKADGAPAPKRLVVPAPAKLNLFLHVTGRRGDGYHLLESLFVPIDLADTIELSLRDDKAIVREAAIDGVPEADDLTLRAAHALREARGLDAGVSIRVTKRIPKGAGLGGGSSDAASVLLALNRMWSLGLSRGELIAIGVRLGADVPFFLGDGPALVRGVGERITPMTLPAAWIALAMPALHVSTAAIFASRELTRSTPSVKMNVFSEGYGRNDLEAAAVARHPRVGEVIAALSQVSAHARMTGSGSCVFAAFRTEREARAALETLPGPMPRVVVRTLGRHPLAPFAR